MSIRSVILAFLLAGTASPLFAQSHSPDPQAIRDELDRLRQEFDPLRQQYGERFSALETKLAALASMPRSGIGRSDVQSTGDCWRGPSSHGAGAARPTA